MSSSFSGLVPPLRPYAAELLRLYPSLTVTSVFRSYSEQMALWNARARNKYPVAPPGRSWHGIGRAWDMVGPAAVLAAAGATWESWGGTWGGRFRDEVHFQA